MGLPSLVSKPYLRITKSGTTGWSGGDQAPSEREWLVVPLRSFSEVVKSLGKRPSGAPSTQVVAMHENGKEMFGKVYSQKIHER